MTGPAPRTEAPARTVLVTGATGFVGATLVPVLARSGWQVRAAAQRPEAIPPRPGVTAVMLPDLGSPLDWSPLLEGVDAVVHLAGLAHMSRAIPEARYHAVNAVSVATLAAAARREGVRRVVMMSSARAQSGPVAWGVLTEADPPAPTDAYGRSKLAGERALAAALDPDEPTDWTVLRPVLIHGPGVKGNMAILTRLAASDWPLPFGAFTARRSILALENLIAAVEHVLDSPRTSRRTFLVADDTPVTVPQILSHLRQGFGRPPGLLSVPVAPLAALARLMGKAEAMARLTGDLVVDTAALRATGWVPSCTTAAALEALARSHATAGHTSS